MRALIVMMVVAACVGSSVGSEVCEHDFGNATFNLESLVLQGTQYRVQDARHDKYFLNVSYSFNVCENVSVIPQTGLGNGCLHTHSDAGTTDPNRELSGLAPAFRVFSGAVQTTCNRLADGHSDIEWLLYDEEDPARGVGIKYSGGDECLLASGETSKRTFTVWIECDFVIDHLSSEAVVMSTEDCYYELFLKSRAACPLGCGTGGTANQMCAGNGVCAYDHRAGKPRCLCQEGYEGDVCDAKTAPDESGGLGAVGVVLIVVSIMLVAMLAGLLYLWKKIQGLRLDTDAYTSLATGDEDIDED